MYVPLDWHTNIGSQILGWSIFVGPYPIRGNPTSHDPYRPTPLLFSRWAYFQFMSQNASFLEPKQRISTRSAV